MSALTPAQILSEIAKGCADTTEVQIDGEKLVASLHANGYVLLTKDPNTADLIAMARVSPTLGGNRDIIARRMYDALINRRLEPSLQ